MNIPIPMTYPGFHPYLYSMVPGDIPLRPLVTSFGRLGGLFRAKKMIAFKSVPFQYITIKLLA